MLAVRRGVGGRETPVVPPHVSLQLPLPPAQRDDLHQPGLQRQRYVDTCTVTPTAHWQNANGDRSDFENGCVHKNLRGMHRGWQTGYHHLKTEAIETDVSAKSAFLCWTSTFSNCTLVRIFTIEAK